MDGKRGEMLNMMEDSQADDAELSTARSSLGILSVENMTDLSGSFFQFSASPRKAAVTSQSMPSLTPLQEEEPPVEVLEDRPRLSSSQLTTLTPMPKPGQRDGPDIRSRGADLTFSEDEMDASIPEVKLDDFDLKQFDDEFGDFDNTLTDVDGDSVRESLSIAAYGLLDKPPDSPDLEALSLGYPDMRSYDKVAVSRTAVSKQHARNDVYQDKAGFQENILDPRFFRTSPMFPEEGDGEEDSNKLTQRPSDLFGDDGGDGGDNTHTSLRLELARNSNSFDSDNIDTEDEVEAVRMSMRLNADDVRENAEGQNDSQDQVPQAGLPRRDGYIRQSAEGDASASPVDGDGDGSSGHDSDDNIGQLAAPPGGTGGPTTLAFLKGLGFKMPPSQSPVQQHDPMEEDNPEAQRRIRPMGDELLSEHRADKSDRHVWFSQTNFRNRTLSGASVDDDDAQPQDAYRTPAGASGDGSQPQDSSDDDAAAEPSSDSHLASVFFAPSAPLGSSQVTEGSSLWGLEHSTFNLGDLCPERDSQADQLHERTEEPEGFTQEDAKQPQLTTDKKQRLKLASGDGEPVKLREEKLGSRPGSSASTQSGPRENDSPNETSTPMTVEANHLEVPERKYLADDSPVYINEEGAVVTDLAYRSSFPNMTNPFDDNQTGFFGEVGPADVGEDFASSFQFLEGEDFVSGDLGKKILDQDEEQFKKENILSKDDLMVNESVDAEHPDSWAYQTHLSVLRPSWLSEQEEEDKAPFTRISIGTFMGERTEALGSLEGHDHLPRPTFGRKITTPPHSRKPNPLYEQHSPQRWSDITEEDIIAGDVRGAGVGSDVVNRAMDRTLQSNELSGDHEAEVTREMTAISMEDLDSTLTNSSEKSRDDSSYQSTQSDHTNLPPAKKKQSSNKLLSSDGNVPRLVTKASQNKTPANRESVKKSFKSNVAVTSGITDMILSSADTFDSKAMANLIIQASYGKTVNEPIEKDTSVEKTSRSRNKNTSVAAEQKKTISGKADVGRHIPNGQANLSTTDKRNLSTADKGNLSTAERRNLSTAEKRNLSTTDKRNLSTTDKRNLSTAEKRNLSATDKRNLSTSDKRNLSTVDKRNLSSADKRRDSRKPADGTADGSDRLSMTVGKPVRKTNKSELSSSGSVNISTHKKQNQNVLQTRDQKLQGSANDQIPQSAANVSKSHHVRKSQAKHDLSDSFKKAPEGVLQSKSDLLYSDLPPKQDKHRTSDTNVTRTQPAARRQSDRNGLSRKEDVPRVSSMSLQKSNSSKRDEESRSVTHGKPPQRRSNFSESGTRSFLSKSDLPPTAEQRRTSVKGVPCLEQPAKRQSEHYGSSRKENRPHALPSGAPQLKNTASATKPSASVTHLKPPQQRRNLTLTNTSVKRSVTDTSTRSEKSSTLPQPGSRTEDREHMKSASKSASKSSSISSVMKTRNGRSPDRNNSRVYKRHATIDSLAELNANKNSNGPSETDRSGPLPGMRDVQIVPDNPSREHGTFAHSFAGDLSEQDFNGLGHSETDVLDANEWNLHGDSQVFTSTKRNIDIPSHLQSTTVDHDSQVSACLKPKLLAAETEAQLMNQGSRDDTHHDWMSNAELSKTVEFEKSGLQKQTPDSQALPNDKTPTPNDLNSRPLYTKWVSSTPANNQHMHYAVTPESTLSRLSLSTVQEDSQMPENSDIDFTLPSPLDLEPSQPKSNQTEVNQSTPRIAVKTADDVQPELPSQLPSRQTRSTREMSVTVEDIPQRLSSLNSGTTAHVRRDDNDTTLESERLDMYTTPSSELSGRNFPNRFQNPIAPSNKISHTGGADNLHALTPQMQNSLNDSDSSDDTTPQFVTPAARLPLSRITQASSSNDRLSDISAAIGRTMQFAIDAPQELRVPEVCCAGMTADTMLPVQNRQSRWLVVGLRIESLTIDGIRQDLTRIMPFVIKEKVIIAPGSKEDMKVVFTPGSAGVHVARLMLLSRPVVHENQPPAEQIPTMVTLQAVAERPNIQVWTEDESRNLDFGALSGGCRKEKQITLVNRGRAPLPLRLVISASKPGLHCFSFDAADVSNASSDTQASSSSAHSSVFHLCLPGSNSENYMQPEIVRVHFTAPAKQFESTHVQEGPELFYGKVDIEVDTPSSLINVAVVLLAGTGGTVRLHTPKNMEELHLRAEEGQVDSRTMPLRNVGNIPMEVSLEVVGACESFTVTPDRLTIEPNSQLPVLVKFEPKEPSSVILKSLIMIQVEPSSLDYSVPMYGEVPSNLEVSHFSDNDSPLLSDKASLAWGGVVIGQTREESFNLQSNVNYTLVLKLNIRGCGDYQLKSSAGDLDTLTRNKDVFLQPRQTLAVHVVLTPSKVASRLAKLYIRPENLKSKFSVALTAYGGISNLVLEQQMVLQGLRTGQNSYCTNLGSLHMGQTITRRITLKNTGERAAFVKCLYFQDLACKNRLPESDIAVHPNAFCIKENQLQTVMISLTPSRKETSLCGDQEAIVACIAFYYGDEISRVHYRKVLRQSAGQASLQLSKDNPLRTARFNAPFFGEDQVCEAALLEEVGGSEDDFFAGIRKLSLALVGEPAPPHVEKEPVKTATSAPRSEYFKLMLSETSFAPEEPSSQDTFDGDLHKRTHLSPSHWDENYFPRREGHSPPIRDTLSNEVAMVNGLDTLESKKGTLGREQWSLNPQQIILQAPKIGAEGLIKRVNLTNHSQRQLNFEVTWPGHCISITPEQGTIQPRSSVILCLGANSKLHSKGVQLPWSGQIIIACDGQQKVLPVQIRQDFSLDGTSALRGTQYAFPEHLDTLNVNLTVPTATTSTEQLHVAKQCLIFPDTPIGKVSKQHIDITNPSGQCTDWSIYSFTSPYIKEVESGNIFRVTYTSFWPQKLSGVLQPYQACQVQACFSPRMAGKYTQYWEFQFKPGGAVSSVSTYKVEMAGQCIQAASETLTLTNRDVNLLTNTCLSDIPKLMKTNLNPLVTDTVQSTKQKQDKKEQELLLVSPKRVIFDPLSANHISVVKVFIRNRDSVPHCVTIKAPELPFHISHTKAEIKNGHFVKLPIKFCPESEGNYQGMLNITSNFGPTLTVSLIGQCR